MERVKVSIGRTYNMGNYESLRLDVGLEADSANGRTPDVFNSLCEDVAEMLAELERKYHILPRGK